LKKRILLAIILLLIPTLGWAGGIMMVGGSGTVAAGGKTYLLQDTFEAADGTELSGYNSWAGDAGTNKIEIDTAQYHGGAASLLITSGTYSGIDYKSFTGQATGKFTVEFWFRVVDVTDVSSDLFVISEGVYDWANNNWPTTFQTSNAELRYYSGNANVNFGTIAATTWYKIEVEYDMTNKYINVWLGDGSTQTKVVTNGAFQNTGAAADTPDSINFDDDGSAAQSIWIDDLNIYLGARQ